MRKIHYFLLLIMLTSFNVSAQSDQQPTNATNPLSNILIWKNQNDTTTRELYTSLGYSGGIPRFERIPRYHDLQFKFLSKMDSVANSGYITHGYFNMHGFSKIDTVATLATKYWVTRSNKTYSGTQTFNIVNAAQVNSTYGQYGNLDIATPAGNGLQLLNGVVAHFYSSDTFSQSQIFQSNDAALNIATNNGANVTKFNNNNIYDKFGTLYLKTGDVPTAAQSNHYADSLRTQILTGNNTYSGSPNFTNGIQTGGGSSLNNISVAGVANFYDNLQLGASKSIRFQSAYTAGNDGYLYHGDELNVFNDPWLTLQIKGAGYKFFRDSLVRISDGKKSLFQGDAPSIADTIALALKIGNANMVQNTYKGQTSISTDHAIQGDSSILRHVYWVGSSLTLGPPQAFLTSDTSTFAYKVTRALGGVEHNLGVGSRPLQQVTVGDNSIYSNMTSLPAYTTGSVIILEGMVNDVVGDTTKYTVALHTSQFTTILNYLHTDKGWPLDPQHIIIFNPFYYNFNSNPNHGNIAYRHSIYNAAQQGLATSFGVGFLDLYSTEPHSYVYQDSLHSVGLGHTWAAGNFVTYSTSQSVPIYNYNSIKNKTFGASITYGDLTVNGGLSVSGPLSTTNIKTPQINVDVLFTNKPVNFLNVQNDSNNRNLNWGGNNGSPSITANTNKGGAIYGYAYTDGNLSPTLRMLSYTSSSTANTLLIGSSLGGQGNLSALDIYGNEVGSTAVKRALFGYLNTGDWILGGGGADVARFTVNQPTTGNGTITVTATGTGIVGTGTLFTNTFKVGQIITANGETHTITAITNNTNMTTDAWTNAFTGTYTLVGGNRLQVFGSGNITTAGFGLGLLHLSAAGVWSSSLVAGGDLSTTIALPSGATATTQTAGTNNTSLATMAALFAERSNAFTYTNKTHDMLRLAAGANGGKGTATLVAGTVTISNTAVTASSIIIPIRQTNGGTLGTLSYTVSAGTGFTITSSSSTDTSVITYLVIN